MSVENSTDPKHCPLCGENNLCGNLSPNNGADCWCKNSSIAFPDSLLSQVSDAAKNKSCICETCALSHNLQNAKSA